MNVEANIAQRPRVHDWKNFNRSEAIVKKLYSMFYENGPGNGAFLSLPFDQLVEHGPGHIFKWRRDDPDAETVRNMGRGCADPRAFAELANSGDFSAIVLHPGLAAYASNYLDPSLPLIYKIDGRANQPEQAAMQSIIGSIDDAAALGATAIGTSLYPGEQMIQDDMERVAAIVREAHERDFPAVVWAYARGPEVDNIKETLYWTSNACSLAASIGADIIKTKYPGPVDEDNREQYEQYIEKLAGKIDGMGQYLEYEPEPGEDLTHEQSVERITVLLDAAPEALVVVSGGPKLGGDAVDELVAQTEIVMDGGAEGRIIGRNFWGRPVDEALELVGAVADVMKRTDYARQFCRGAFTS